MFLDVLDFICDFPWTVSHFQMFARQLSGCHICGFTLKCGLMSLWIYTVHCPLIWSIKVVKWTTCKVPYIHRTCGLEYCGTIFKLPSMMSGKLVAATSDIMTIYLHLFHWVSPAIISPVTCPAPLVDWRFLKMAADFFTLNSWLQIDW